MGRPHGFRTRGIDAVPQGAKFEGRFGRMFWNLPLFSVSPERLERFADAMENASGDAQGGQDNENIPAGFTYLGQFIDHDITHDASSSLERMRDPNALINFRSPSLDLDSLYGRGPVETPFLYNNPDVVQKPHERYKLVVGRAKDNNGNRLENQDDLPRNEQDVALIGDPRNDENTFVSQLHLLFVKFHNRVVDEVVREQGLEGDELFKEAQRLVRWHYQWIVVNDYLRRTVPEGMVEELLVTDDRKFRKVNLLFYKPEDHPFMPLEFSVAAFRFGHSQVRNRYSLNGLVQNVPTFLPDSELPSDVGGRRIADFRGFRSLPGQWQPSWPFLFELDEQGPQKSHKIDTRMSRPLVKLPREDETDRKQHSLALRNLRKGKELSLPSGEWVARAMGHTPLDLSGTGLRAPTPLWFYILREAENQKPSGSRLGPVGGRIVAEVLLGLLDSDPLSYLNVQPNWEPELSTPEGEQVESMTNLIKYADPANARRHNGISR